jgi:hypothetical protein
MHRPSHNIFSHFILLVLSTLFIVKRGLSHLGKNKDCRCLVTKC